MLSSIDPQFRSRLSDPLWRLNNLYWIENKSGRMQRFTPNAAQLRLQSWLGRMHTSSAGRRVGWGSRKTG